MQKKYHLNHWSYFTIEEEEEEIGISGKISLESLEFVLTFEEEDEEIRIEFPC